MKSIWVALVATICIQSADGTASGQSPSFNPAISVNGLFLGFYGSDTLERDFAFSPHGLELVTHQDENHEHQDESHETGGAHEGEVHHHGLPDENGLSVQEVEVRLTANVDTYIRGDVTLAIPGTEGLEVEEGFVETIGLPNITLRAGKFFSALGRHNRLHTHAFPFIDPPVAHERLLGGEGLNEVGIRASLLLPVEWFSELNIEILDGENVLFDATGDDLAYLGTWKNFWDLSDATTVEAGGSIGVGKNKYGELSRLIGGDLTIKWRPTRRGVYRSLTVNAEYLQARVDDGVDTESIGGLGATLQVQMAKVWWLQGRYDVFGLPSIKPDRQHRVSALVAFLPSEFSALRLQYSLNKEADERVHQLALQLNFTIGSHPAHNY